MFFWAALSILVLDQWAKSVALNYLAHHQSYEIIRNVLHFTFVSNTGAAFGILKGLNKYFILVTIAASISIIIFYKVNRVKNLIFKFSLGLILGGALSNLIDRVRLGYVIDFIDFRVWPVFNIADSAITIGVILIIFKILIKKS